MFSFSHFACPRTIILTLASPEPMSIRPIKSAPPSEVDAVIQPALDVRWVTQLSGQIMPKDRQMSVYAPIL